MSGCLNQLVAHKSKARVAGLGLRQALCRTAQLLLRSSLGGRETVASGRKSAFIPVGTMTAVALGPLALASIVLGFYQGPLGQWLGMK